MSKLDTLQERAAEIQDALTLLNAKARPFRESLSSIDREMNEHRAELEALKGQIEQLRAKPRVSDHAVIRYLERKYGFSFEAVREGLLTPAVLAAMDMGAEGVKVDGGSLKIRGRTVTTFIGKAGQGSRVCVTEWANAS